MPNRNTLNRATVLPKKKKQTNNNKIFGYICGEVPEAELKAILTKFHVKRPAHLQTSRVVRPVYFISETLKTIMIHPNEAMLLGRNLLCLFTFIYISL